jgi:hypothetical protein
LQAWKGETDGASSWFLSNEWNDQTDKKSPLHFGADCMLCFLLQEHSRIIKLCSLGLFTTFLQMIRGFIAVLPEPMGANQMKKNP